MQTNVIYAGDCIRLLPEKIPPNSVDLVFADPPYNLSGGGLKWQGNKTGGDWHMVNEAWDKMSDSDYSRFTLAWIGACGRALKDPGAIYIACSYHNLGETLLALKKLGFKTNNVITWHKTNAMPNMTKRVFTHCTEFVVWAVKGSGWVFNYDALKQINPERQKNGAPKQMRDCWPMPLVQGRERLRGDNGRGAHPTQKPEEMLKRIILASSHEGDIVLDPFLGSGTTAAVAQQYKRRWIGIEKNAAYVKIAKQRLANGKSR